MPFEFSCKFYALYRDKQTNKRNPLKETVEANVLAFAKAKAKGKKKKQKKKNNAGQLKTSGNGSKKDIFLCSLNILQHFAQSTMAHGKL